MLRGLKPSCPHRKLYGVRGTLRALGGEVKSWASYSLLHHPLYQEPAFLRAWPGWCQLLPAVGGGGAWTFSQPPLSLCPCSLHPSLSCSHTSRCIHVSLPPLRTRLHRVTGQRRGAREDGGLSSWFYGSQGNLAYLFGGLAGCELLGLGLQD